MKFEHIKAELTKDIIGGLIHEYVVDTLDGDEVRFIFFQKEHEDDLGKLNITAKIDTDLGVIDVPYLLIPKEAARELAKAILEETND